jgi:hypothetical protein
MAIQVNEMLVVYGLNAKILTYVKDEGNNLSTMTNALTFVVSCKLLRLTMPFIGSSWGHAMFKCC